MAGLAVLAVVFIAGLAWAKWIPYEQKASKLSSTHCWSGGTLFADSGKPGAAPTFSGAWHFKCPSWSAMVFSSSPASKLVSPFHRRTGGNARVQD